MKYEMINHTGDIGIKVEGDSCEEIFATAAYAMFDVLLNVREISPLIQKNITITADSIEELLNFWLSELLKIFYVDKIAFCEFDVKIKDNNMEGSARGELFDSNRHFMNREIKAVTFHNLYVKYENGKFSANVIFDV